MEKPEKGGKRTTSFMKTANSYRVVKGSLGWIAHRRKKLSTWTLKIDPHWKFGPPRLFSSSQALHARREKYVFITKHHLIGRGTAATPLLCVSYPLLSGGLLYIFFVRFSVVTLHFRFRLLLLFFFSFFEMTILLYLWEPPHGGGAERCIGGNHTDKRTIAAMLWLGNWPLCFLLRFSFIFFFFSCAAATGCRQ